MTEPNEQQAELIRKNKGIPNNYKVLFETKNKLVLQHKRGSRRTILKGD